MVAIRYRRLLPGVVLVLGIVGVWSFPDRAFALVPPTNTIEELEGNTENSSTDTGSAPGNDNDGKTTDDNKTGDPEDPGGETQGGPHAPEPASMVSGAVGAVLLGLGALRRKVRTARRQAS